LFSKKRNNEIKQTIEKLEIYANRLKKELDLKKSINSFDQIAGLISSVNNTKENVERNNVSLNKLKENKKIIISENNALKIDSVVEDSKDFLEYIRDNFNAMIGTLSSNLSLREYEIQQIDKTNPNVDLVGDIMGDLKTVYRSAAPERVGDQVSKLIKERALNNIKLVEEILETKEKNVIADKIKLESEVINFGEELKVGIEKSKVYSTNKRPQKKDSSKFGN